MSSIVPQAGWGLRFNENIRGRKWSEPWLTLSLFLVGRTASLFYISGLYVPLCTLSQNNHFLPQVVFIGCLVTATRKVIMQAMMGNKCVYLLDTLGPFPERDASNRDQSGLIRIAEKQRGRDGKRHLSVTFVPLNFELYEYVTYSKTKFK